MFDIIGYQDRWKSLTYQHICRGRQTDVSIDEFDSDESEEDGHGETKPINVNEDLMDIDQECDVVDASTLEDKGGKNLKFLLGEDDRFINEKLVRPVSYTHLDVYKRQGKYTLTKP